MGLLGFIALVGAAATGLFCWTSFRLIPILRSQQHADIKFSPHELRLKEVTLAIVIMLLKAALRLGRTASIDDSTNTKGHLTLTSPFRITEKEVARYQQAVGSAHSPSSELAPTALLLFLAAVTEPAMLLLLTNPSCPINPLGAVNVRNRFEVLRSDLCHIRAIMSSHDSRIVAKMLSHPRAAKRGIEYDLEVAILMSAHVEDKRKPLVPVYRQTFTMLEFKRMNTVASKPTTKDTNEERTETTVTPGSRLQMSLSSTDPLSWAALCKDYNPIHLSGLAAKLFGLPGKLAHGNHVAAIAIERLLGSQGLQRAHSIPTWMEVDFLRPIVVPSVLDIEERSTRDGVQRIVIRNRGRDSIAVKYGVLKL
jgi:acyl dehydratase